MPSRFFTFGPEILDHHVGFLDQPLERGQPFGRLQVERDAALVAMQVLKVRSFARAAHRLFGVRRRFDLDDVGAPVGKLAHAGRPGAHARQIEHGKARERLRRAREGTVRTPFSFSAKLPKRARTSSIHLAVVYRLGARYPPSPRRAPYCGAHAGHLSGVFGATIVHADMATEALIETEHRL